MNGWLTAGVGVTAALALVGGSYAQDKAGDERMAKAVSIYDFTVQDIDGNNVPLAKYRGDVLVVVNVASK